MSGRFAKGKKALPMAVDEERLIAQSKAGDLAAFNSLVEQYQGQVYAFAFRMLGNRAAVEDVTQEAFFSAYRHIADFRGGSFRSWLLRITANACVDLLRASRKQRGELSLEDEALSLEAVVPSREEGPEEHALRRELGQLIQQGLARLPVEQRLVVVLVDVQGLSYEEAAEATGSNLGTVRSRLSRGRHALRQHLLQQRELLPAPFRHISEEVDR